MPARPAEKKLFDRHLPALDGLRGLAFLVIFFHHAEYYVDLAHWHSAVGKAIWVLTQQGWLGVDVFFALSGFLITGNILKTRESTNFFTGFYVRRALRIWPLFFLIWGALFFAPFSMRTYTAAPLHDKLLFMTGAGNLVVALRPSRYPLASVSWSLAVEEQFYLIWPFLVRWFQATTLVYVCAVGIAAEIVVRLLPQTQRLQSAHNVWIYCMTYTHCDGLLAGSFVAAALWCGVLKKEHSRYAQLLGLLCLAVGTWMLVRGMNFLSTPAFAVSFASLIAFLVLREDGRMQRIFSASLLRRFGKYSYSMYLTHSIIYMIFRRYEPKSLSTAPIPLQYLACVSICLSATFLLGYLSWKLLEGPANSLKRYFPYRYAPAH